MRTTKSHWLTLALLLLLAGAGLTGVILQAEQLWLGEHIEELSRAVYRPVFIALAPLRGLAMMFQPPHKGHFPLAQTILLCLAAPAVAYVAWRLVRRFWPSHRTQRSTKQGMLLTRRNFLAACGAAPMGGAGVYGVYVEPERLHVARYEIPIVGLPASLDGLRVAHVSDTHYGPFMTARYLRDAMARVNALEPDLVVLTGDYVHKTPHAIGPGIGLLADLQARLGVVAVMGNHEHWEGAEACRARFREVGIPLLDNARCFLSEKGLEETGDAGRSLCLAGVDDLWDGDPSLKAALRGVPEDIPRLVLSHNPDFAETDNAHFRVDLMLAGHTHGGQVRLPVIGAPGIPSRYGDKYEGGLCEGPWCPVLVSRGVGLAGLPIRLGVPPEIGLIHLKRANPRAT